MPDDALEITSRTLEYRDRETTLEGSLHWPVTAPAQGSILLVHGGAGLDQHARDQAARIAAWGYAVFACDMYVVNRSGGAVRRGRTVEAAAPVR